MSDASSVSLYVENEASFGVAPATLYNVPLTGESLKQVTENESSNEIRADRNVADNVRTAISASGDVNFEWKYDAYDKFMISLFMQGAARAKVIDDSAAYIFTAGTNTVDSGAAGVFTNAIPGDWFFLDGTTTGLNDGFFRIETVVDPDEVTVSAQHTIVTQAAGPTVHCVLLERLRNSNSAALSSISMVKVFNDHSPIQLNQYLGCRIGGMSLNIVPGAINQGSFSILGLQEESFQTSIPGVTLDANANINQVTNSVDHIALVREGDAVSALDITELSFTCENNLRTQPAVAQLEASGIGRGRFMVSGSFKAYFTEFTAYEKYLAWTASNLSFHIVDDLGNRSIFDIPQCRFTDGQVVAGGNDTDVIVEINFEAYLNATYGHTMSYCIIDAADLT